MMDLEERSQLARSLLENDELRDGVTKALFERHPNAKAWGITQANTPSPHEMVRSQVAYLAGAVQAGNPRIFGEYAVFCCSLFATSEIELSYLREIWESLAEHLRRADRPGRDLLESMFACAQSALQSDSRPFEQPADARTPLRLAYLSAALAGRRHDAGQATREATGQGLTTRDVYQDLLLWAQRRLGELSRSHRSIWHRPLQSLFWRGCIRKLKGRALLAGL